MSLTQKKYKRLLAELRYVNTELRHVEDILREAHIEFEIFYQQYCKDYGVPIKELNEENKDKLKKVLPKQKLKTAKPVVSTKSPKQEEKADKILQKMYRKAAIATHPDKFSDSNEEDAIKASETFKKLTSAFNEKKWADFLDICEKLDILPTTYKKVFEIMRKEISLIKTEINKLKQSYSWKLFECDDDTNCKIKVIKGFLHQIFGYEKK